jgi:hypothetical protein
MIMSRALTARPIYAFMLPQVLYSYSYLTKGNRVIKTRTVRSAGRVVLTEGGRKETLIKCLWGNLKKRPI